MVAAFGNLHVGRVRRGEAEARRVIVGNVNRLAGDKVQRLPGVVDQPGIRRRHDRRRVAAREDAPNDVASLRHLVQPHERIDFRQLLDQLAGKPLRHAAADDEPLARPALHSTLLMRLEDRFDGFLLRGVNERAGVHDQHVGILRGGGHVHALGAHAAEHDLGVHEVFRAAQRDHADFFHRKGNNGPATTETLGKQDDAGAEYNAGAQIFLNKRSAATGQLRARADATLLAPPRPGNLQRRTAVAVFGP